jgi:hypothetical protein
VVHVGQHVLLGHFTKGAQGVDGVLTLEEVGQAAGNEGRRLGLLALDQLGHHLFPLLDTAQVLAVQQGQQLIGGQLVQRLLVAEQAGLVATHRLVAASKRILAVFRWPEVPTSERILLLAALRLGRGGRCFRRFRVRRVVVIAEDQPKAGADAAEPKYDQHRQQDPLARRGSLPLRPPWAVVIAVIEILIVIVPAAAELGRRFGQARAGAAGLDAAATLAAAAAFAVRLLHREDVLARLAADLLAQLAVGQVVGFVAVRAVHRNRHR